ncbi:hypothetical protein DL771_008704 [Monosporascus sp. 5C6A]|nr:hypothetical protein DL771_008704 [Monosporascus sp. 5C6A]
MERLHRINPFAKRDEHSKNTIITYKILTTLTWLLSIVVSFYYTFNAPDDGSLARRRIWRQNDHYHTAFRMNHIIANIYWLVLFVLQAGYIAHLFSGSVERVNQACSVGSHFIANNLLHFAFVMLFVRSHFIWAEVMIVLNFINLSSLYFRHPGYARFIHQPVVSGPLAWTFVAIYWNGAIMVHHPESLVARIFGNIFIWSILVYGLFFIVVYKVGALTPKNSPGRPAIGVAQFFRQVIAFQWIFAFTIMAVLFIATVVDISNPGLWTGAPVYPKGADEQGAAATEMQEDIRTGPQTLERLFFVVWPTGPKRRGGAGGVVGDPGFNTPTRGQTQRQKRPGNLEGSPIPGWQDTTTRFAAKEAAIKAHPHRRLTLQSVSIMRYAGEATPESDAPPDDDHHQQQQGKQQPSEAQPAQDRPLRDPEDSLSSGPPVVLIKGDDRYEDCYASISISHDGEYATAVCLGVSPYADQAGGGCLKRV